MYEAETKEIETYFKDWIDFSKLTVEEFIRFRTIKNFKIKIDNVADKKFIILGYESDGSMKYIGEPIVIKNKEEDMLNASLFIVYVANMLDAANINSPLKIDKRPKYFYNIGKEFIKLNLM